MGQEGAEIGGKGNVGSWLDLFCPHMSVSEPHSHVSQFLPVLFGVSCWVGVPGRPFWAGLRGREAGLRFGNTCWELLARIGVVNHRCRVASCSSASVSPFVKWRYLGLGSVPGRWRSHERSE